MNNKRRVKDIQQARGNAVTRSLAGRGGGRMRWRSGDGRCGQGVVERGCVGGILDDSVNGQIKTRGEAMIGGVGKKRGAHIVVRESVKLLIGVLLPRVRLDSGTMRIVCWVLKDGGGVRL